MITDTSKEVFIRTWGISGYLENWAIYGAKSGVKEEDLVARCLSPFYHKEKTCLEIGCGAGFWTDKYLAPNFQIVIALDLIPRPFFQNPNIIYIEVGDRDFSCAKVADDSIDFVWSFGVFCHLTRQAIQEYLRSIHRKCKTGAKLSLYFSNNDRRPHYSGDEQPDPDPNQPMWCNNNMDKTMAMLDLSGFRNIKDLMPELFDSMVYCEKS